MTQAPTHAEIKALIIECLDGGSILAFTGKEEFFGWLETTTHYDATDEEEDIKEQRGAIYEVYEELFLEEFFARNKSVPPHFSEAKDDHQKLALALESAAALRQRLIELHSESSPLVSELIHDPMVQVSQLEVRLKRWTTLLKPSE